MRLRNQGMESKKKHALKKGGTKMGLSDDLLAARKHASEVSQRKKMEGSKQLSSENAAHRQAIKSGEYILSGIACCSQQT